MRLFPEIITASGLMSAFTNHFCSKILCFLLILDQNVLWIAQAHFLKVGKMAIRDVVFLLYEVSI